jgi:hypothetical protein
VNLSRLCAVIGCEADTIRKWITRGQLAVSRELSARDILAVTILAYLQKAGFTISAAAKIVKATRRHWVSGPCWLYADWEHNSAPRWAVSTTKPSLKPGYPFHSEIDISRLRDWVEVVTA